MKFTISDLKQALIAILIGAVIAFLSSLFDGLIEFLQGWGNNIVGGGATALVYWLRRLRV